MKGDVWYLKDATDGGTIIFKFEFTEGYFQGNLWEAISWVENDPIDWHFVAEAYLKWDSCSHWWFNGQSFDPDRDKKIHENEIDPYYHLCGPLYIANHIRAICFVWKLAEILLQDDKYPGNTEYFYKDSEELNTVIELMLKDCVIEKEEPNETQRIP